MFKKSIITLLFLAAIGYASAQSLQFEYDGTVFYDGEAVECTNDEYGYGELIQHMQVRNLTSAPMSVLVKKEVVEDMEGVINSFCWGMCYGPDVIVSPAAVEVQAGSLNTDDLSFHALFDEVYGAVVIKYCAYNESNPEDAVSIIVRFNRSGVGVNEHNAVCSISHAYPNPASSMVRFDYRLSSNDNASVAVYNLLGQEVMKQELNGLQGQISISVADLNEGIYFCNLMVNGQALKTEKFVVKK